MTRNFFGKTYYSHGVMNVADADKFTDRALAAGFTVLRRVRANKQLEVFIA